VPSGPLLGPGVTAQPSEGGGGLVGAGQRRPARGAGPAGPGRPGGPRSGSNTWSASGPPSGPSCRKSAPGRSWTRTAIVRMAPSASTGQSTGLRRDTFVSADQPEGIPRSSSPALPRSLPPAPGVACVPAFAGCPARTWPFEWSAERRDRCPGASPTGGARVTAPEGHVPTGYHLGEVGPYSAAAC